MKWLIAGLSLMVFLVVSAPRALSEAKPDDFPRASSEQVRRWLAAADEVVLYVAGGRAEDLVNEQVRLRPAQAKLAVQNLGTDPRGTGRDPNRLVWARTDLDRKLVDELVGELVSTRFFFLPPDRPPGHDAVIVGVEIHQGERVRRWFWEHRNPSKVVLGLTALIDRALSLKQHRFIGDVRGRAICGSASETEVRNDGAEKIALSVPEGHSRRRIDLGSGQTRRVSSAKPVWIEPLSANEGLDSSVLVLERCDSK